MVRRAILITTLSIWSFFALSSIPYPGLKIPYPRIRAGFSCIAIINGVPSDTGRRPASVRFRSTCTASRRTTTGRFRWRYQSNSCLTKRSTCRSRTDNPTTSRSCGSRRKAKVTYICTSIHKWTRTGTTTSTASCRISIRP